MKVKFTTRDAVKMDEFHGWKIWEQPKSLLHYAIGADVAEGLGRDASCAQVICVQTGKLVAQYWSNATDVDTYSAELYKGAHYYNTANLLVEANNHGAAVIVHLSNSAGGLAYPKLYKRYQYDEYTQKKTPKIGLKTTGGINGTKARIIENLKSALRDGQLQIPCPETIKELSNYVRDPKTGRMGASGTSKNSKDDRVMALALAWEQTRLLREYKKDFNNEEAPMRFDPMTGVPLIGEQNDTIF